MGREKAGAGTRAAIAAVRALLRLPPPVKRRMAGPVVRRDGLELDLDAQLLLRITGALPRARLDPVTSPPRMRVAARRMAAIGRGPREFLPVCETTVAGGAGRLRARVYRPADADTVLVWFHGGGWVIGDLDTHDGLCRTLAATAGVTVISVDYRLAPEHPYPAAVDDAAAAFTDIVSRATEFGATADRVAIGGDSAGGHLAALLALRDPDAPLAQLLVYPPTDLTGSSQSRTTFAHGFALTRADIDFYDACFLPPDLDRASPEVSPLFAQTTVGLPPTVIITAGFDPLRDEGESYAERLRADGVAVRVRRFDGYLHGFVNNALAFGPAVEEIAALFAETLAKHRARPARDPELRAAD